MQHHSNFQFDLFDYSSITIASTFVYFLFFPHKRKPNKICFFWRRGEGLTQSPFIWPSAFLLTLLNFILTSPEPLGHFRWTFDRKNHYVHSDEEPFSSPKGDNNNNKRIRHLTLLYIAKMNIIVCLSWFFFCCYKQLLWWANAPHRRFSSLSISLFFTFLKVKIFLKRSIQFIVNQYHICSHFCNVSWNGRIDGEIVTWQFLITRFFVLTVAVDMILHQKDEPHSQIGVV